MLPAQGNFDRDGTFLLVELHIGDKRKGLGSGETQSFFPLWLQKSWEPWTTFGEGGYWINPGSSNKNYLFFGWAYVVRPKWTNFSKLSLRIHGGPASNKTTLSLHWVRQGQMSSIVVVAKGKQRINVKGF